MPKSCCWLLVLISLFYPKLFAEELTLNAETLFERGETGRLRYSEERKAIELERGVLYEDDGPAAGFSYQPNEEKLTPGVLVRKTLIVPSPRADGATLLVARGGELTAKINGAPGELRPLGKQGNYWQAYAFEPTLLKAGENEFILAGKGSVWISRGDEFAQGSLARPKHPNRSAKSLDRGRTWNDARLGTANNIDGEYAIRVFLDQFQPEGRLRLGVVDAGNLAEKSIGPPVTTIGPIQIQVDVDFNKSEVQLRARTGSTYVPDPAAWSDWIGMNPGGGTIENPRGRYLQIEFTFVSADGEHSPAMKSLRIWAKPDRPRDWTKDLVVRKFENPKILRSSIPFAYEPFDRPELAELRRKYRLDQVVAGAKSEFEIICLLAAWSAGRWEKMHLKEAYPDYNALEILKAHPDGTPVGGFCQQYNIVFLQACESLGFSGRLVSIGPGNHTDRIRGGHETAEIWSNEHGKWVYVDGNTAWYAVDKETRIPLSLLELRERQLAAFRKRPYRPIHVERLAKTRHEWKDLTSWPPFVELRLIPRSNFLEQTSPLPLNQGMRGWFWTGHYVWTDDKEPARPIYSRRIAKKANFAWTLNQAHMALEAQEPGRLRVHLDTHTPGFQQFLRQTDEGEKPAEGILEWNLQPGENRLQATPENNAGRKGIPARIELDWSRAEPGNS